MRTLHELHVEIRERPGRGALVPRPLIIGAGVIGGILVAFVFALALAHPAGASTSWGPTTAEVPAMSAPAAATASTFTKALLPVVPNPGTAVVKPAVGSLATTRARVITDLAVVTDPIVATDPDLTEPLTNPIVQGLAPAVGPVVQSVTPVRPPRTIKVSNVVNGHPAVGASRLAGATTTVSADRAKKPAAGLAVGPMTTRSRRRVDRLLSPSIPPSQRFPSMAGSSLSVDSVPSPGSHALAVTPGSGLVSPDSAFSKVDPVQSRTPDLLFDLRHSPPG